MNKFYYFVLIGAPGSGKGTQGEIIAKKFNLLRISPGEIFREMIKNDPNSATSKEINALISNGNLVPIEVINKVMSEYIEKNKKSYSGIIFDGYPRNLEQESFLGTTIAPQGIDAALYLEISLDQLVERLLYRQICRNCGAIFNTKHSPSKKVDECDKCGHSLGTRTDDANEQIIQNRFNVFMDSCVPIVDKYKKDNKLIAFDANKSIETISKELESVVSKIIKT